jgi:Flp pilus assembly protein TadG
VTGDRDEGQAAVELALVLPLLALLLLAVVQVVLVARDQILVVHAARAGARHAAVDGDASAVRRAVHDAGAGGLDASRLTVEVSPVGRAGPLVTATVRYRAPTDVPLVGPLLPDVPLLARASMASELSASVRFGGAIGGRQQEPRVPGANSPISTVRGHVLAEKVVSRGPAMGGPRRRGATCVRFDGLGRWQSPASCSVR